MTLGTLCGKANVIDLSAAILYDFLLPPELVLGLGYGSESRSSVVVTLAILNGYLVPDDSISG